MLLARVIWMLTIVIYVLFAVVNLWWFPAPISQHGVAYDQQFKITLAVCGVIFFIAQMALGWAIYRYRSNGQHVEFSHGNNKLEIFWTSAAAFLFIGLVLMGSRIWAGVHFEKAPPDAIPIQLLTNHFPFAFPYPHPAA